MKLKLASIASHFASRTPISVCLIYIEITKSDVFKTLWNSVSSLSLPNYNERVFEFILVLCKYICVFTVVIW